MSKLDSFRLSKIISGPKEKKLKPTLDSLLTLVETYKGDLDLDKMLNTIGLHLLNLDISTIIFIFDDTRQNLVVRHSTLAQSTCLPDSRNCQIVGKALPFVSLKTYINLIKNKKAQFVPNRHQSLIDKIPELGKAINQDVKLNCVTVPLVIRGEVIGVLEFLSPGLKSEHLPLFDSFTKNLVKIMANSILFQEIQASEERFRNLIDNASETVLIVDPEGYITMANRSFFKLSGYTKEDLPHLHFSRIVHPSDRQTMQDRFARRRRGELEEKGHNTFKSLSKEGIVRHISYSVAPVRKGGQFLGMQIVARDETDNLELQKKLRQAKEHYEKVIDAISDSICVIDKNYQIISYNKTFARQVDIPINKLKGQDYREMMNRFCGGLLSHPCQNGQNGYCLIEKTFAKGIVQKQEIKAKDELGHGRYFSYTAFPKKDENGVTFQIVITIKDISDRKQAEEELANLNKNLEKIVAKRTHELEQANIKLSQANSLKLKFISDASHELRTPLTVIQGNLELAQLQAGAKKCEHSETFEAVLQEVERMRHILSDLTLLTNADSLTETIMMEEVELGQVVEAVVKSLKILADQKKIYLSYKQNTKNYHILGDEAKLEKMLLNIVRNALKYTDPKGKVTVWTESDNGEVRIYVGDNGIGIPEEDLPFIFERFYRVDKARARAEGGTGLGLSICKWIAEGHGGTISVSSIVDKGTVFTIHLPINRENNLSTIDQKQKI